MIIFFVSEDAESLKELMVGEITENVLSALEVDNFLGSLEVVTVRGDISRKQLTRLEEILPSTKIKTSYINENSLSE